VLKKQSMTDPENAYFLTSINSEYHEVSIRSY
jgi:hypothetical protein